MLFTLILSEIDTISEPSYPTIYMVMFRGDISVSLSGKVNC
jgi:hypothetical protein